MGQNWPSWLPKIWGEPTFAKFEEELAKYLGLESEKCADGYIESAFKSILIEDKGTDFKTGIRQLRNTYTKLTQDKKKKVDEIILKIKRIKSPEKNNYKFDKAKEYNNRRVLKSKLSGKWTIFKQIGNQPIFNDYGPPENKSRGKLQ